MARVVWRVDIIVNCNVEDYSVIMSGVTHYNNNNPPNQTFGYRIGFFFLYVAHRKVLNENLYAYEE